MRGEYLFRRGRYGIFYFRWPVPRPLQSRLGKTQIWKSLGTQDYALAQCRAARLWAALTEESLGMGDGQGFYDMKVLLTRVARPDGTETANKSITISGIHTQEDMERARELLAQATGATGQAAVPVATAPKPPGEKCSAAFRRYVAEKHQVTKAWTDNTRTDIEAAFKLFLEIVGDHPIGTYADAERAREFRAAMLRIPPNWRTSPAWRDKTIQQILSAPTPEKTQAVKTVNKKIRFVAGFFDWYSSLHSDILQQHPYGKLLVPQSRHARRRDHEERRQFTKEEVQHLLEAAGKERERPYQFWSVALGAHTGARLNELAQLRVADVQEIEGVWSFRFQEEEPDQRLKTEASQRVVPIHSALIAAGFIRFIEERRRAGQERLFPELRRDSKGGYSAGWSKWFGRFRARLGIGCPGDRIYGFHSFRHTVATALTIAGVPPIYADDLTGHERGGGQRLSERERRYAKTPEVEKLKEYIEKLDYGTVLAQWPGLSKFRAEKQKPKVKRRTK